MDGLSQIQCWRALESLRNGVPNRDAVSVLGSMQLQAEKRFDHQLGQVGADLSRGEQPSGLLLAGAFGAGKSHLLEYFHHVALERSFVCSHVVISKETPLADPAKVLRAAVENAVVPQLNGSAVTEVAARIRQESAEYQVFRSWAHGENSGLGQMFPASLYVFENSSDDELKAKIIDFWAGSPMSIAELRRGLRDCGGYLNYAVASIPVKQLARQRALFLARLFVAAGYEGWVILLDEVELIGRYSLLQRGRAYAELAKWLGHVEGDAIPGVLTVGAITDDFELAVLQEKGDADYIVPKLRAKNTDEYNVIASRAETGMRLIRTESMPLAKPVQQTLDDTYARLKMIHSIAYGWSPPDVATAELTTRRAMRSFVRRWINEWDLARLYPGETVSIIEDELTTDYSEDAGLGAGTDASRSAAETSGQAGDVRSMPS